MSCKGIELAVGQVWETWEKDGPDKNKIVTIIAQATQGGVPGWACDDGEIRTDQGRMTNHGYHAKDFTNYQGDDAAHSDPSENYTSYLIQSVTNSSNEYIDPTFQLGDTIVIKESSQQIGKSLEAMQMDVEGYECLEDVLLRAYNQAARGKGHIRHSHGEPFNEQMMQDMAKRFGVGVLLGQAFKKSEESMRLSHAACIKELLGAINYLAGAVIFLEARESKFEN